MSDSDHLLMTDAEIAQLFAMSRSWVRGERQRRRNGAPHFLTIDPMDAQKGIYLRADVERVAQSLVLGRCDPAVRRAQIVYPGRPDRIPLAREWPLTGIQLVGDAYVAKERKVSRSWVRAQRRDHMAGLVSAMYIEPCYINLTPRYVKAEIDEWVSTRRFNIAVEQSYYLHVHGFAVCPDMLAEFKRRNMPL